MSKKLKTYRTRIDIPRGVNYINVIGHNVSRKKHVFSTGVNLFYTTKKRIRDYILRVMVPNIVDYVIIEYYYISSDIHKVSAKLIEDQIAYAVT